MWLNEVKENFKALGKAPWKQLAVAVGVPLAMEVGVEILFDRGREREVEEESKVREKIWVIQKFRNK